MNKRETHIVTGMTKDMSVSRFNNQFVVDARNIRITSMKGNSTLLSVTNEKGTGQFSVTGSILGTIIGHAVLNKTLVLFTTDHTTETTANPIPDSLSAFDRIYKLDFASNFSSATATLLFEGNLNFYYKNPLETLPYYETDSIQKVYWVDGRNQPRVIDINRERQYNNDVFNFNREIGNDHSINIEKFNTGGQFPAGTIQYCFNYFNKFGQETNIVDVSPMYYLCPQENGLPADGMDTSSFQITLDGLNGNFEYVRLYAIVRTSENATPNVRIVGDYKISTLKNKTPWVEQDPPFDSFDYAYAYVYDLNTGEEIYKLDTRYSEPSLYQSVDIPLTTAQALYISTSGDLYAGFSKNTGTKRASISISHDDAGIHVYRNSPSVAIKTCQFTNSYVDTIIVTDTGIVGSTIDANTLLFIGGQNIIANTFTSKNNTLFLGNIKQNIPNVGTIETSSNRTVSEAVKGTAAPCVFGTDGLKKEPSPESAIVYRGVSDSSYYNYLYDNNKSSYDKKSFKAREGYRLGFVAQHSTGQWSEAVWIDDLDETMTPSLTMFYTASEIKRWGQYYKKPGFEGVLPVDVVNALIDNGFIRVAPVVCYPEDADRKVPFQGLLSGTVYNVLDRNTNSPFAQADWRFRMGYDDNRINGEIQCNTVNAAPNYPVYSLSGYQTPQPSSDFVSNYGNQFYRDSSILTFHSPDVEFNEAVCQGDLLDLKMRIVGISTLSFVKDDNSNNYFNQNPERTLGAYLYASSKGYGKKASKFGLTYFTDWRKKVASGYHRVTSNSEEVIIKDYYADLAYVGYYDNAVEESTTSGEEGKIKAHPSNGSIYYYWVTYLWHRNGSLNNQAALSEAALSYGSIRYAVLEKKCISETRYSRTTFFQTPQTVGPSTIEVDINQPMLFDSDQLGVTKVPVGNKTSVDYYGNIDKVITPTFKTVTNVQCPIGDVNTVANLSEDGYPIEYSFISEVIEQTTNRKNFTGTTHSFLSRQSSGNTTPDSTPQSTAAFLYGTDPVHMRYKSTKHIVFGLSSEDNTINQIGIPPTSSYPAFWMGDSDIDRVDVLSGKFDSFASNVIGAVKFLDVRNSVFIAELYKEFSEERLQARFGGSSDTAIANNVWKRCGDSVKLIEDSPATMYFKEGDTYIGRYDCLKTYPFSPQDQNQIVSVFSTELESRVNLDARYDKNKGLTDNTFANPTNFDLFNHPGYEQTNQFFTYKAIDYDRYKTLNYPNLVTFSTEKKPGEDIDAWTSIPMTSTFDMRGELGEITKLTTFNDSIFSFQNRGVAQILFNERVQIPVSDSQPIEITNGMKYGGYRYLSDQIGLTNKWSLATTPYGIYFIDDEKNTLYNFGGQEFRDISTKAGFRTWLEKKNSYTVWNPKDYGNFRTWYDKVNGDLYFMDNTESLVFSEQLGNFISFMDYGALPMLVNMNDKFLTSKLSSNTNTIWELWAGSHNMFFGTYKPYSLTFISNTDPTVDKVFNNLAWRTLDYASYVDADHPGTLQPLTTFDTLRVWNDHQDSGDVTLADTVNKPSPIKKKFDVFRAVVPRDRLGLYNASVGRDRIRNTWAYIKFSRAQSNTDFFTFMDLDVDFFE